MCLGKYAELQQQMKTDHNHNLDKNLQADLSYQQFLSQIYGLNEGKVVFEYRWQYNKMVFYSAAVIISQMLSVKAQNLNQKKYLFFHHLDAVNHFQVIK